MHIMRTFIIIIKLIKPNYIVYVSTVTWTFLRTGEVKLYICCSIKLKMKYNQIQHFTRKFYISWQSVTLLVINKWNLTVILLKFSFLLTLFENHFNQTTFLRENSQFWTNQFSTSYFALSSRVLALLEVFFPFKKNEKYAETLLPDSLNVKIIIIYY